MIPLSEEGRTAAVVCPLRHAWRGGGADIHSGTSAQRRRRRVRPNDDNAFRHHYRGSERLLAGLGDVHVGVWTSPEDHSFWPIPQSRPVLVQLLGSPDWASRPAAYAAAALRLVRAHPNIRELQVWNDRSVLVAVCAGR
jgi:hypothetical protein